MIAMVLGRAESMLWKPQKKLATGHLISRANVVVTTTVTIKAAFIDNECEPFDAGSVCRVYVPAEWLRESKKGSGETTLICEIWRDGKPGKDAEKLEALIAEYLEANVAGDRRKSDPIQIAS